MVRLTHYATSAARAATFLLPGWLRRWWPAANADGDELRRLADVNDWGPWLAGPPETAGTAGTAAVARPTPVVLVHGTETGFDQWLDLIQALRGAGHRVFALSYGREDSSLRGRVTGFGTGHLSSSAGELALFVERVRETTGAERVDIVGHSQGGLLGHLYVKWLGGDRTVRHLVTLGAPVHGASPLGRLDALVRFPLVGAGLDALLGPSAREQVRVSPVIRELVSTPDVVAGVRYTAIITRYDDTVLPVDAQRLQTRDGVKVANRFVQDAYPDNLVSHARLPLDPQVIEMVLEALGRPAEETQDAADSADIAGKPTSR